MSGVYFHIPYCAKACHYCDFHFSTNSSSKYEMVQMMVHELTLRKSYIDNEIDSIYFGGGTPSLLSEEELRMLMQAVYTNFSVNPSAEITLESNPDDLSISYLSTLKKTGINRLSIGIQSFDDEQLGFMNRLHTSTEAVDSVRRAKEVGFQNLTIDLIYGIPLGGHQQWLANIEEAIRLEVPHISAYCLTIEPNTVFGRRVQKGILSPAEEEYNAHQFELLQQMLTANGYEQYEVSNFSKPNWHARHNSSYWLGSHYLGIGPAAHSYNGVSRQYNVAHNTKYIQALKINKLPFTYEPLDLITQANEYILTRLRTKWGVDFNLVKNSFGISFDRYTSIVDKYQSSGHLVVESDTIKLTQKGLLLADKITEDLFII